MAASAVASSAAAAIKTLDFILAVGYGCREYDEFQ